MFHRTISSKKTGDINISIEANNIKINTDRLEFRSLNQDDYNYLVTNYSQLLNKPEITKMLNDGTSWSVEKVEKLIADESKLFNGGLYGVFSVYSFPTNQFVGSVSIRHRLDEYAEVGIGHKNVIEFGCFLDPAFWGKGYASEMAIVGMKYTKHIICHPDKYSSESIPTQIVATAHPSNERSIAILRKTLKNQEPEMINKFGGQERLLFFKPLNNKKSVSSDHEIYKGLKQ